MAVVDGCVVGVGSSNARAVDRSAPRRYGARRYWHGANEQFSHGTRSRRCVSRSTWRVRPNTASSDFFGRSMPESSTSSGPGSGAARCREQREQRGLLGDVPLRIAGAVVRQHRQALRLGPAAQAGAGLRHQVLDDGRAVDLEEEVLVGLLVLPQPRRFRFELGPGADGDQHRAVRPGVDQRSGAGGVLAKRRAVEAHAVGVERSASTPRGRRPTAGRARRTRPRPRPASAAARPSSAVPARIAEQPLVLGGIDLHRRPDVVERDHRAASGSATPASAVADDSTPA